MMNSLPLATFTVPLSVSAHQSAQLFCSHYPNPQKAKQVYLNTLAVWAVQTYLHCMDIETDWVASQSQDLVMQAALDVADLELTNLGKLECRPVLPEEQVVQIPFDVSSDRIGYVAVRLNASLQHAEILGFTSTYQEIIPIEQLRSLDELQSYLYQLKPIKLAPCRINLSAWFENLFEAGWQSLESLMNGNQVSFAVNLRTHVLLNEQAIKRAKLLDLGLQLGHQSIAILLAIAPNGHPEPSRSELSNSESLVEIVVQIHPMGNTRYLPPNLTVRLCTETGEVLQEIQSREHDNFVQLKRFWGTPNECFNLELSLGEFCMTELFMI